MIQLTKKGYSLWAVSSSFQKCVRRGLEADAMYWAVELWESGYDEYLWKRIKVIVSEDIGLAEPNLPATIHALASFYKDVKAKTKGQERPSERIFLTHAVMLLCRAKKSRVIDHVQVFFFRAHKNERKPVPDFAKDKHTAEGKRMGRGLAHFFDEGAKLNNMGDVDGEEHYLALAKEILFEEERQGQAEKSENTLF